jgi:hypothetical protein
MGRIVGFCFGKTAMAPKIKAVTISSENSIMIILGFGFA